MPSKKPKTTKQSPVITTPITQPEQALTCPSDLRNFPAFGNLVAASFQAIVVNQNVFVIAVDGDALYAAYLAAFPEGTNPILKARTEHDCATCRQFVRRAGDVVAVVDGVVKTVWDESATNAPYPYNIVAERMRQEVLRHEISNLFRVEQKEGSFGAAQTRNLDPATKLVVTHNHFYTGEIPKRFRVASPGQECGDYKTTVQVFERGLSELRPDAVETVLGLIDANNLYRGEEHRKALVEFQAAQRSYTSLSASDKKIFIWINAHGPAARFRNTVIGTLVQELSEGKDLDRAVQAFETKVAPQNYKRTSAVITPAMVKKAMETVAELGLEPALERRFAVIGDVSVKDVLWVDGAAKPLMKGGIGDVLMQHAASNTKSEEDERKAEQINLSDFVSKVLPEASSMELLFKSEHLGNLMSLTAPVHSEPKQLFRWSNDFAWSYCGNITDSIKEKVKKAGGRVDGASLRISLSWFNYDDLDLHIYEPARRGARSIYDAVGEHIFFRNKTGWTAGTLDVDMNAGGRMSREPVENVVWTKSPPDGVYRVVINQYNQREMHDFGFVVEIEANGKVSHYSYNKAVRGDVEVVKLHFKNGVVERFEVGDSAITAQNISQDKWGLRTEQYVKVNAVTLSPNYWGDNAVGNKHTFFVLDGCKNDEPTRGIYNEFLHSRLEPHRKVFEVIGDKTKCAPTDNQLSGLGFSSTKRDSFIVRVNQGKKRRLYNVQVGN